MIRLLTGDCRKVLKDLEDESIHCCVTSPPYFGLRDYGIADQIGLEPTPQEYVDQMVAVFRKVRRVLRDDGTLWLNLGDTYANTRGGKESGLYTDKRNGMATWQGKISELPPGLKAKDLIGIPWRVAFALQADGWYLRQDIIWSKPSPMPESVTDRCTKAHEYIFLLSKNARYYYDADAIAEPVTLSTIERVSQPSLANQEGSWRVPGKTNGAMKAVLKSGDYGNGAGRNDGDRHPTRNKRSVWEIATQPYSEAHFATFPPALIEPCILAGCPERVCAKCGGPWVKIITTNNPSKAEADYENVLGWANTHGKTSNPQSSKSLHRQSGGVYSTAHVEGEKPSCTCDADTMSGTVIDPFAGAGTTGLVADRLGRNAILVELNEKYAAMAERRIRDDAGMFAELEGWTPRANSQTIAWIGFVSTLCLSHGYLSMFTNAPVIWIC